ncbi:MAG: SIS domain-containing protein [Spirochaetales bacterium]|nr:SIS domain-containing protein [Spirochaetales bacterium]
MDTYFAEVSRQPEEVERILSSAHTHALDPRRPIRLTGIGTSLHACRVAEHWIRDITDDAADVRAEETHYFSMYGTITPETQIVVVSHRGTKKFPKLALEKGRACGADTIAVTADSEVVPTADVVLRTCSADRASTHTVSYTSALAVMAQLIANTFGKRGRTFMQALHGVADSMRAALGTEIPDGVIERSCAAQRILTVGFGVDAVTADEAALKIKEGTYKWADSLTTEFALHGPPAAYDATLHAFVIEPNVDDLGRTRILESVLSRLGASATTIGTSGADITIPDCDPLSRPFVAVIPLQSIVGTVACRLGTNPDTIRTDTPPWSEAMTSYEL